MRKTTLCLAAALLASLSGCNCATTSANGGDGGRGTTGSSGGSGSSGTGSSGSSGSTGADGGSCTSNSDCGGGVCLGGLCCAAGSSLCGGACCAGTKTCLFDACVSPGEDCHTSNDCPDGQYCETALAVDGGAAATGDGGQVCTSVASNGRCLPLPPVCYPDGGGAPGCTQPCVYFPTVGNLDAVTRWSWGSGSVSFPDDVDVWATPAVARLYDTNCDGVVDAQDTPVVVFVSGNVRGSQCAAVTVDAGAGLPTITACRAGVLRAIDGRTGKELWSLDRAPDGAGWAGLSVALGDIDGDGQVDIAAVTGDGHLALVDATGRVKRISAQVSALSDPDFGWGGGLAIADMAGDGHPEIAFGASVFDTADGGLELRFAGTQGQGGPSPFESLSTFARLLADGGDLQLLAGNTAYLADGGVLWNRTDLKDGFSAVGDFNRDGEPEAVLVDKGVVYLLDGATGATVMGPFNLPGTGHGGPPTVADFDGDHLPEIGVAQQNYYTVLKPDFDGGVLKQLWATPNHDLSSSVTGSTVFDFEGDGRAEVVYADECFLWVFDGQSGKVKFSAPHTSFTGTEASLVADVDGDGRAEMMMVSNGASPTGWKCAYADGGYATVNDVTWTPSSLDGGAYRGIALFADRANSWVGTRTLWNEHTYHVSNICDDRDSACPAPNLYGSIPRREASNYDVPWLNDFRQNVQDQGLFDAPDAVVSLDSLGCDSPAQAQVSVRNQGQASLPANVEVAIFAVTNPGTALASGFTTHALGPGQTERLSLSVPSVVSTKKYFAQIVVDPANPGFHECRADNDTSASVSPSCLR